MRNRIDYGIDLETTNSIIARVEKGVPPDKIFMYLCRSSRNRMYEKYNNK
jgi:hypothetical protein